MTDFPRPKAKPGEFLVFIGREGGPPERPDEFEPGQGRSVDLWTAAELDDALRNIDWLMEWAWEQFSAAEKRLPDLEEAVRIDQGPMLSRAYNARSSSTLALRRADYEASDAVLERDAALSERSRALELIRVLDRKGTFVQTRVRIWERLWDQEHGKVKR
jgi:hypothetical protein